MIGVTITTFASTKSFLKIPTLNFFLSFFNHFIISTSLSSINWQIFGLSKVPLTDLAVFHYGAMGGRIFTWLVYISIIGSVAGWIVSTPRLLLAMAEDKLILTQFKKSAQ